MSLIRRTKGLPVLLGAALALLFASDLSAYVIYLKDGTRLTSKEKPTVQGDRLLFVTKIGVMQSVPVADFDRKKTEEMNRLSSASGDAYVLTTPRGDVPIEADQKESLSEFIRKNNSSNLVLKEEKPSGIHTQSEAAAAAAAPAAAPEKNIMEKGLPPGPSLESGVSDAFVRALESSGLKNPRLVSIPHGVRIQAVTDNEQQVFAALGATARGLKEARAAGKAIDRAEIWLVTSNSQSAGHFEMSPEDADALLNGKIGAAKYFVGNVIF
jgi:hypothetical protein